MKAAIVQKSSGVGHTDMVRMGFEIAQDLYQLYAVFRRVYAVIHGWHQGRRLSSCCSLFALAFLPWPVRVLPVKYY